jgi:hypothetical protein
MRQFNFPLMLLVATALGAIGSGIANAIKEDDIGKSAKGGAVTGIFTATVAYLWFILFGFPLPIP